MPLWDSAPKSGRDCLVKQCNGGRSVKEPKSATQARTFSLVSEGAGPRLCPKGGQPATLAEGKDVLVSVNAFVDSKMMCPRVLEYQRSPAKN